MRPSEIMRVFLSRRWAGLALAILVAAVGLLIKRSNELLGLAVLLLGGLMLLGTIVAIVWQARLPRAPGSIYVINGRRVHIIAEGDKGHRHPVIWVAGGHGEGLIMSNFHRVLCEETRSILFDRTGSGWTGPASGAVTFSGEVEQLRLLLEAAGESGPFVMVGHSFGGLFCANFAHHNPDLVAAVVLLDSTPPWNVAFAGKLSFNVLLRKAWWGALASHFGLHRLVEPEIDDLDSDLARELSAESKVVNAHSVQPKSLLAEASVFVNSMANPFDLVIGKGALKDIPLLLMSANPSEDEAQDLRCHLQKKLGLTERQTENLLDGLRDSVDQQLALSSRSRHRLLPVGASHMFPYEYPDIVLEEVRAMIRGDN